MKHVHFIENVMQTHLICNCAYSLNSNYSDIDIVLQNRELLMEL